MNRSYSKIRHIQEVNQKIEKKLISEQTLSIEDESDWWNKFGFDSEESFIEDYSNADDYAQNLNMELSEELYKELYRCLENSNFGEIVNKYQNKFKRRYNKYVGEPLGNDFIDNLMGITNNPDLEYTADNMIEGLIESLT